MVIVKPTVRGELVEPFSHEQPFDRPRVTVTQIILARWDHRVYAGDPILHSDPFDDKAQELLTLVEGQRKKNRFCSIFFDPLGIEF